ncbi:MAG: TIGR00266 family protein [Acidimicrobiia bacterium]
MEVQIDDRPSYAIAKVALGAGEEIIAEGGAMVGMTGGFELETKARGGFLKSVARSTFGGESFFLNTFKAPLSGGTVRLAPALPGDMRVMELVDDRLMVQSGGFIASSPSLEVETKWSGAKTFFASEGLIMLRVSGSGTLIIAAYGAIEEIELGPEERFTVDTGHLVTFTEGIGFDVRKVGGWKSTLFSGEGLVVDLTGPGKLTLQTRSQDAFLGWLIPQLPSQKTSSA